MKKFLYTKFFLLIVAGLFLVKMEATTPAPAKQSLADKLKAKAAAAAEAAKKAAAAAAEKAKKAASEAAAKAKAAAEKAAAELKKKAVVMAAVGKKALEELKKIPSAFGEKMKTLSFDAAELDLTFPMKIEIPPSDDKKTTDQKAAVPETINMTIGIKYPLFAGYGDISTGFVRSEGLFFPDTLPGPVPLPSALIIEPLKSAPVVGDMLKKVMSLSPQTVFLLKVVALANDAKKKPAAESALFFATNLNLLLSRLAQTPEVKGVSDLLAVLPDVLENAFKDILNKIELPIDEQEVQEFNDRRGKPASDMEKNVSLVRWSLGFSARLALAREKILPLISSNLVPSDKNLLVYFLERSVYDLDKGFEDGDPQDGVNQIIQMRADDMLNFLDTVEERCQQAGFSVEMMNDIDKLQGIVKSAKESKKITLARPYFGGNKQQKTPLLKYLDVMFFSMSQDVLQKKFEEDGDFHEGSGSYLFDDSYLNKSQAKKYMMAILFRCVREKNNEQFDLTTFLTRELASFLFVRIDESYRKELLSLVAPFVSIFQKMKSVAQAAQSAAVSVAGKVGAGGVVEGMTGQASAMAEGIFGMAQMAAQEAIYEEKDSLLDDRDFALLGLEDAASDEATAPADESVVTE